MNPRNHHLLFIDIPDRRRSKILIFEMMSSNFPRTIFQEIDTIYRILAAIIHLGDVEVRPTETSFQTSGCVIVNAEKIPQGKDMRFHSLDKSSGEA